MTLISRFIDEYTKKHDFYREAGRICAQICETNMEHMGIRAIVSYRAKKPDRLKDKLEKRNIVKKYDSFTDIIDDVADLSGVRIALYFPGDLYKVQQFIDTTFVVKECRVFPESTNQSEIQDSNYKKRFSGYWATHYRLYLNEKDLPEEAKKYSFTMIEIQVASALMHAWAEVEHDLVYKPFSGELSYEEYQILDELNGLVLAGEIALQRLQKAVKNRVTQLGVEFNNHYEVALFLNNRFSSSTEGTDNEIILGRVDLLFSCIKSTIYNKPERLLELLPQVNQLHKDRSIVEQVMDRLSETDSSLYEKYRSMKQNEELRYQMEILHMNCENGNRQGEANTLANIGYIYSARENYDEAINYFTKAVKINNELGGIQGEANQLLNLGSTYRLKGETDKALEYCNLSVKLHRQISYKQGQASTLGMIGNIYSDNGNLPEALKFYNESLNIFRESNYRIGEVNQLNNIGMVLFKQSKNEQALEFFGQAEMLSIESDYRQGEGEAAHHIGDVWFAQGNLDKAMEHYGKALNIQEAADNQKSKIGILMSIGKVYFVNEETEEAIKYYKDALSISKNIAFKNGEEEAIEYIRRLQSH